MLLCAITTVLFLGGWRGPAFSHELGPVWTLLKVFVLAFVVIWLRVSYPRLREDQLQKYCWKFLIPLSLVQVFVAAAVKLYLPWAKGA